MNQKNYFIVGGTGGIGKAMVEQLIERSANNKSSGKIFATYHTSQPDFAADNLYWLPMDISNEKSSAMRKVSSKPLLILSSKLPISTGWLTVSACYIQQTISQKKHYDNWRRTSFCKICRLTP